MDKMVSYKIGGRLKSRYLIISISFLCCILLLLSVRFLPFQTVLTGFLLCTFFAVAAFPLIRVKLRGESIDPFEIIYPVCLILVLNYGFRAAWVFFNPSIIHNSAIIDSKILNSALFYLIIGTICFLAAYYSRIAKKIAKSFPTLKGNWSQRNLFNKILSVYLLGIGAIVYGFTQHYFARIAYKSIEQVPAQNYIMNFSKYTWYALIIALITNASHQRKFKQIIFISMFAISLTLAIVGGIRGDVVFLFFIIFMFYNYRRRLANLKRLIIPFILILLFLFPFMLDYRNFYKDNFNRGWKLDQIGKSLSYAYRKIFDFSFERYFAASLKILPDRQHAMDSFCVIIRDTPYPNPYMMGRDYLWIVPNAIIPRTIWKDKPEFQDGAIFPIQYWGVDPLSWPSPSSFVDLYMNFGLIGIIAGMLLLGVLYRFMYLYFIVNTNVSSPGLFFYIVLCWPMLALIGEQPLSNLSEIIKIIIYLVPIHLFMKIGR